MICGALILCSAAWINGGPIMYPDTLNYWDDGHALFQLSAPNNTRPIAYGLAIAFLHWEMSAWPILLAQGLVVAHIVHLTIRVLLGAVRPAYLVALLAGLAVLTPLSWYVSHVLPDIFSAVMVLALFLLTFGRERMSTAELVYVFLLAAASICFHLTNVVTGTALVAGAWVLWLFLPMRRPLLPTASLLLAVGLLLCSSLVLYQRLSLAPKSPPFLMARVIADGPGRDYLRATCPQQTYRLCADLDRLPDTENGILWRYMAGMSDQDGKRIRAEADAVVKGTVAMFPAQVAWHMLLNTARQAVTVGSGMEMLPEDWARMSGPEFLLRDTGRTLQRRGVLTEAVLAPINLFHAAVAAASALACIVLAWRSWAAGLPGPVALAGTVLLALLANAFVTGALGGVFGRYEGRLIWLLPLAAVIAALALRQRRAWPVKVRAAARG